MAARSMKCLTCNVRRMWPDDFPRPWVATCVDCVGKPAPERRPTKPKGSVDPRQQTAQDRYPEMIAVIAQGNADGRPPSVRKLAAHFGISPATVAYHLKILAERGKVERVHDGYLAGYRVPRDSGRVTVSLSTREAAVVALILDGVAGGPRAKDWGPALLTAQAALRAAGEVP
jgi:DNA-binding transcriptional ArsR family regulator